MKYKDSEPRWIYLPINKIINKIIYKKFKLREMIETKFLNSKKII